MEVLPSIRSLYFRFCIQFQLLTCLPEALISGSLELLFATGVQVSELCALQYEDVRLDAGEVKAFGKGAKERHVQIANPDLLNALLCYNDIEQVGTFFVNRCHKPLSDPSVRSIVTKYSKLAGVENHITPHMFRHTFATHALASGVDVKPCQVGAAPQPETARDVSNRVRNMVK